jgi:hypothetical protein
MSTRHKVREMRRKRDKEIALAKGERYEREEKKKEKIQARGLGDSLLQTK